jgi:hypothetical protein
MQAPTITDADRRRRERQAARILRINDSHPEPRTEVIAGTTVEWSQYRALGGPTISGTWQGQTAGHAADASPHAAQFRELVRQFAAKATRHEKINVHWWYAPFIYIEVEDTRHRGEYPVWMRALVSFDLTNGLVASPDSSNRYAFARKGWGAFVDRIAGYPVPRYQG